jgi:hypothetical protein
MKGATNPVDRGDRSHSQVAIFVGLFGLLAPSSVSQTRPASVAGQASPVQPAASSQPAANFTDVTSTLGIDFEYAASHTSRKYLIETMGSGVALFDHDNDGRLDIFVVNGAPLSDPTPKGTAKFHLVQPYSCYAICNHRDFCSEPATRSPECEWQDHQ